MKKETKVQKKDNNFFNHLEIFYEKYEKAILIITTIVAISGWSQIITYIPMDYLWNFGNIYKLASGYKIYDEVKIIITPIFFWTGEFFFRLINSNIFTYNIYNIFIETILMLMFYKILNKISKNKLLINILYYSTMVHFLGIWGSTGANYITFSMIYIFTFILINIDMKDTKIRRVINGTIGGLALFTYQKAGAAIALTIILYEMLHKTDENFFEKLANITISAISMIIVSISFICYIYIAGHFNNFIDMTILGMSDFKKNFNFELKSTIILVLLPIISTSIFIFLKKNKKNDDIINCLWASSIGAMLFSIPIVNLAHINILLLINIVLIYKEISKVLGEMVIISILIKKFEITFAYILTLLLLISGMCYNVKIINAEKNGNFSDFLFGSNFEQKEYENIYEINNYIVNKRNEQTNVVIFSGYAMEYIENYRPENYFFDVPNTGNFGKKGQEALIEKTKDMDNTLMLVQNKERTDFENYQFPDDVRNYIQNNYKKVGEIQNYDIYLINNK